MKLASLFLATSLCVASAATAEGPTKPKNFGAKEVLATAVEITIRPCREYGEDRNPQSYSYPPGSPVRVLVDDGKDKVLILIGESKEQAIVSRTAIIGGGESDGKPVTVRSLQPPTAISTIKKDGPPGIWTGVATGDEDIPSSNLAYEQRVLELTNLERSKHGLSPLVWDEHLARAARYYAADMYVQDYLPPDHATYDVVIRDGERSYIMQESCRARIVRFAPYGKGENIAGGRQTPEEAVALWMRSQGHRENILRSRFKKIGVGFITGRDGVSISGGKVVQVFGI